MMRGTWVYDEKSGEMVPKDQFYSRRHVDRKSRLSSPMIIGDGIEVQSMVDGKTYTSKSALRRSYKDRGYVEVGNERQVPANTYKPDRKGIRDSIGKAFNRVGLPTT